MSTFKTCSECGHLAVRKWYWFGKYRHFVFAFVRHMQLMPPAYVSCNCKDLKEGLVVEDWLF